MSAQAPKVNVDIYPSPTPHGDYLAVLNNPTAGTANLPLPTAANTLTEAALRDWSRVKLIINLDTSGSMCSFFGAILRRTFPTFFRLIGLPEDYEVTLIMFTDHIICKKIAVKDFPDLKYEANGCERLAPCMNILKELMDSYPQGTVVSIISLSDGEIGDVNDQMIASAELYQYIQSTLSSKLFITSHGVRVYSGYNSGDTRALSSVLQFHNLPGETPQLLDLECNYNNAIYKDTSADALAALDARGVKDDGSITDDVHHPAHHGKQLAEMFKIKLPQVTYLSTPGTFQHFIASAENQSLYLPHNTYNSTQLMSLKKLTDFTSREDSVYYKYPESHKLMFLHVPFCRIYHPDDHWETYADHRWNGDTELRAEYDLYIKSMRELKQELQKEEQALALKREQAKAAAAAANGPTQEEEQQQQLTNMTDYTKLNMFKSAPWSQALPYLSLPVTTPRLLFWLDKTLFDEYKKTHGDNVSGLFAFPQLASSTDEASSSATTQVIITFHEKFTQECYEATLLSRMNYYLMQAKLLKLVGQDVSKKEVQRMTTYFKQLEAHLENDLEAAQQQQQKETDASEGQIVLLPQVLKHRLQALRKTMKKGATSLAMQLGAINNLDAVGSFNNAQAADFLRTTGGTTKASRGLVDRNGNALDFGGNIRKEVVALVENLPELEAALADEEANHNQSFVSLGTTLDGIRALASLALTSTSGLEFTSLAEAQEGDTLLDQLSPLQILSYLNIVGVPAQCAVGDYPDPYRFNFKTIFAGHFCSLSDIITHHDIAQTTMGDGYEYEKVPKLSVPGYKGEQGEIDTVVPLFDSPQIFQFLYQHAPCTLNYYISVAMRRVIADIPGTVPAMLSAALIKMIKVVSVEPTEVNLKVLHNVYASLKSCSSYKYNVEQYKELLDMLLFDIKQYQKEEEVSPTEEAKEEEAKPEEENKEKANKTKMLPVINSSFSQLLLPLIQLYQQVFVFKNISQGVVAALKERYGEEYVAPLTKTEENTAEHAALMQKLKHHFNIIFRTIYTNEVWCILRTEYRGKQESVEIIEKVLQQLCGFDTEYTPQILHDAQQQVLIRFDAEANDFVYPVFDAKDEKFAAVSAQREEVVKQVYNNYQHKINFMNILLLVPFFAKVLSLKQSTEEKYQQQYAEMVKNVPLLFPTAESVVQKLADQGLSEAEKVAKQQQHTATIRGNVNKLYLPTFYTKKEQQEEEEQQQDEEKKKINFNKLTWFVKLINITMAFKYSTLDKRYTVDTAVSHLPDWNNVFDVDMAEEKNIALDHIAENPHNVYNINTTLQELNEAFITKSEQKYTAVMKQQIDDINKQISTDYCQLLLNSTTLPEFEQLLREGIARHGKTFKFKNQHDKFFATFFHKLTHTRNLSAEAEAQEEEEAAAAAEAQQQIPLQLDKIITTINAKKDDGEIVWNNGNLVFVDSLHLISKLFYANKDDVVAEQDNKEAVNTTAVATPEDSATPQKNISQYKTNQRTKWIAFSKNYLERKRQEQWNYRASDVANRHSHCNSKKSFWGLGYTTLEEYQAAVSADVFKQYCTIHAKCCGVEVAIGAAVKKVQGPKSTKKTAEQDADEEEENFGDLF